MYLIVVYTRKVKEIDGIEYTEVYDKYKTEHLKIAKRRVDFFRKKYPDFHVVLKERTGKNGYIELNY